MNVRSSVYEILSAHTPMVLKAEEPIDDVPLGEDGLGLDSIAIAEVLLACEERFGVRCGDLLDSSTLTIRRLTEHMTAGARR